ncbi:Fic family protein [Candidatus Poriferisodalis sp.]|uniref:Fic family protein n=1 Tax=Candidatus Poriferisodalis sp. TaxID=3101277 RepID=UPI003B02291A
MKMPQAPPDLQPLLAELANSGDAETIASLMTAGRPVDGRGRYLHWDDMRYRDPSCGAMPRGATRDMWWLATWLSRGALRRTLPLKAVDGSPFSICMVDPVWEALHRIDQSASGDLLAEAPSVAKGNRDRYVVSSLIEEAVASSQLEGASSTRAEAKQMLLRGRAPRNKSEQMILNNFRAMEQVRELAHAEQPVTIETICELHRIVTDGTLGDPADAGRMQTSGETRVWVSLPGAGHRELRAHTPPPAAELRERLAALCTFAAGERDAGFVHPVVRAVVLHFWLAYDHPFVDGNGRLARSLFYWSMLRSGYWLAEFLAISAILRKAPAQYARSYLLTETDSNDVTYFVLHQLDVIERAIEALRAYLRSKLDEVREVDDMLRGRPEFNHRQREVLAAAMRDPGADFAIAAHRTKHAVTYQTARTDLLGLREAGLLDTRRDGRSYRFLPPVDLAAQIRRLASGR